MPTEPVSRRSRPAKAPLSRRAVVDAAMRVMHAEGLSAVTMRRIAAELDTGPASLYVYVSSVAELHGAMVDELLTDLVFPARVTRATWRKAVVDVLVRLTELLYAEPNLALSAVSLRPSGPRWMGLIDWLLQQLRRGDVPVKAAAWGVDLLLQHAVATAAEHGLRRRASADAELRSQVDAVVHADPGTRPGLAWAREDLYSGAGAERLRWFFDRMLVGIAAPR